MLSWRALIVASCLLCGCASTSSVQLQSSGTAASPAAYALVRGVNDSAHSVPLIIRELNVDVAVHGAVVETTMTFDIHAPAETRAPVEGRLHVDLPPGAVVTGYALDVNGGLVDGSLVDQSKAKSAYEQQVRKEADPGYTELDQAGGFNTRIFPVDSEKGRRVRLRFVAPVAETFRLPLRLSDNNARLAVRVTQPGSRGQPRATLLGGRIHRTAGLVTGEASGPAVATLVIKPDAPDALASRHSSGEEYWQLSGPLPSAAAPAGGTLRIYWDRSRSRRDDDHSAELARVKEAISALRPDSIEWVAFSSGEAQHATIAGAAQVEQVAKALRYGGATDFSTIGRESPAAACLLVSDGTGTFGEQSLPKLPCRTFAVASPNAKLSVLQFAADSTGGRLITGPTEPADWLRAAVTSVTKAGQAVPFVSLPAQTGTWRVIVPAASSGQAVVNVGGQQFRRSAGAAQAFDGDAELFASARLALLEDATAREKFVEVSRRYSIASPTLSFVVLERPEDYVRYDVAPPANYTRKAEWEQLAREAAEDESDARANRFDEVLKDWNDTVAWWNKKFDLTARPKTSEERKAEAAGSTRPLPAGAPPPPSPPPPAPERDDVAVSGSRVPQANLQNASPVTVVTSQEVKLEGTARLSNDVSIAVSAWRPERDYLNAYDANPSDFDQLFAEWDKKAGDVPAFYLDTADWLYRHDRHDFAIETLLSALDLPTANDVTLGMVAARLERYGAIDAAVRLRERQAVLDKEHPQPQRLLALALARRAELRPATTRADLERALPLLTSIALKPLDSRWRGIDMISLVEANALLVKLKVLGGSFDLDPRLTRNLDSDVRVVLDWSTDAADIDLWVDEPNGERAIYSNPRTLIGGHLSDDMTSGFGPEEYFLRRAASGRYTVRANVYSPDRLDPNGLSRVTAHLFRDWGRPTQREESIDLDLQHGQRGEVRIGILKVPNGKGEE